MGRKKARKSPAANIQSPAEVHSTGPAQAIAEVDSVDRTTLLTRFAFVVGLLLLVYLPALGGGVLWDDPAHMTQPPMASLSGLAKIWFDPAATQQYYPLLHSFFWLQHQAFGASTTAHHIVNLLLHAGATILAWLVLRQLRIPGAFLVALIFSVHPLQVESVAWISEQKNTLSAIFYLSALLTYLRFDRSRSRRDYGVAIGLFVLGLASKTIVATLPAAILVIFWWRRGRLDFRRDVPPLLPFFVLSIGAAMVTSHMEFALVGGVAGPDFDLSIGQRLIQSGKAVWFYAGKLFWPTELMFFYPRWTFDATDLRQWLPFATAIMVVVGCWALRHRTRAPLAAVLLFGGTLFPALGFVNVYPFRFSYVADHFQYLAGLSLIALAIGSVVTFWRRWHSAPRRLGNALAIGLVLILAGLSWRESHRYGTDDIAFYRSIIEENPKAWIAEQNLAMSLQAKGDSVGALPHYLRALAIHPDLADVRFEVAGLYYVWGRKADAVEEFDKAVRLRPWYGKGRFNYGAALVGVGARERAIAQFDTAASIERDSVDMQRRVAEVYLSLADTARAMAAVQRAFALGMKP